MKQVQLGQSATEILVCASFVLVPLFLSISLLGKYIDMKQTGVQAARYQAWEHTVWFVNEADKNASSASNFPDSVDVVLPFKSVLETRNETKNRFFRVPGDGSSPAQILPTDMKPATFKNPLWRDHQQNDLYDYSVSDHEIEPDEDTPKLRYFGEVMEIILNVIKAGFGAISSVMGFLGSEVGFTAINTNGFIESEINMDVNVNGAFISDYTRLDNTESSSNALATGQITFQSKAAVLSDAWGTGGTKHTYNQVAGAVPTSLLNELITQIPFLEDFIDIAGFMAPEIRTCFPGNSVFSTPDPGSLWLGYIDADAIHPDRLGVDPDQSSDRNGSHVCDDAGICTFVPTVLNAPSVAGYRDHLERVPLSDNCIEKRRDQ